MTRNTAAGNTEPPARGLRRIGSCLLDEARGVLIAADGTRTALRPKTLSLFQLLLERSGDVVTRDLILDLVWPGLVVTDDNITQCVVELRKALGPADAGMLRTLPRRGYQLQAGIGKYRVLSKLGEGATSEVFLARDDFADRDVAIKRLRATGETPASESADASRHAGLFFAAEAALVGRLHHPNVVEILDAVADGPMPYLVMEYVPGVTLRRFCRPDALLPLEQVTEIAFKCAMALGYCWRQGLIHRDIKPANVLALMEGERVADVKITDFGSVLDVGAERTQVLGVGSLAYMAPEQIDGADLDARTDMYSLSVLLYHLIAGRPPFDAQQHTVLMRQIQQGRPPALTSLREGVSPALDALVRKGMARQREHRFKDWDEYASQLSALVSRGEVPRAAAAEVLDSERFTLLRSLEFFSGFGDVALWEVVRRARWERHPPGHALYRKGGTSNTFHILAEGAVEVWRDGRKMANLFAGTSVGEMAYLAPDPELTVNSADVTVTSAATMISFTPDSLRQLSLATRALFDRAFIRVLVRRLHAAWSAPQWSQPASSG
jgi:DNA-binding winged helix-turn-helix (wHTH) protein